MSQHVGDDGQRTVSGDIDPGPNQEKTANNQDDPMKNKKPDEITGPLDLEGPGSENSQYGVQKVEAITSAWSKRSLVFAYTG
jgi:hypothetical protein